MSEGEFYVTGELVRGLAADYIVLGKYYRLGGWVLASSAPYGRIETLHRKNRMAQKVKIG